MSRSRAGSSGDSRALDPHSLLAPRPPRMVAYHVSSRVGRLP